MKPCPHCGYVESAPRASDDQIRRVRAAAEQARIPILPGDFVAEPGAAELLGLSTSGLRKQVMEGRNQVPFIEVQTRRRYRIEHIAEFY